MGRPSQLLLIQLFPGSLILGYSSAVSELASAQAARPCQGGEAADPDSALGTLVCTREVNQLLGHSSCPRQTVKGLGRFWKAPVMTSSFRVWTSSFLVKLSFLGLVSENETKQCKQGHIHQILAVLLLSNVK